MLPANTFTKDLRPRSGRFKRPPFKFALTRVGRGATVGATVVCGHDNGAYAMIAAVAVVTKDVPAHASVAGVPARRIGFGCVCGETLPRRLRCACKRRYRRSGAGLVSVAARGPTSR